MNHWSDTRWASWGVALLILVSLLMFGALGCQKVKPEYETAPCIKTIADLQPNMCIGYDQKRDCVVNIHCPK